MRDTGQNKLFFGYYLVGAAFLAQFVAIGIYSYVLGSFMMPMIQELGWTRAEFSLTRTIGQLVMAFVGVFVGVRVDRFGGRPIMLWGATVLCMTLIAHSFYPFPFALVAAERRFTHRRVCNGGQLGGQRDVV